ncbi:MAG: hydroxyethylthiazole kinase [Coriobacteriaceae bacterium]|jgi:hydroxyethylthiazole kinase|nr:hydroxyethylthiazole kinase [Coriobacteriaceae bacterium]
MIGKNDRTHGLGAAPKDDRTHGLGAALDAVRAAAPLVHSITNYVTVNDCANALLAIGASPIMSDEPADVVDITDICGGLVLNIGTLNSRSIEAMFVAGKRSGELAHPIVLDPVGAGASALRTTTAARILDELAVSVVRSNMSEAKALALGAARTHGVDVSAEDAVTEANLDAAVRFACDFAAKAKAVVAITGPWDIVADSNEAYIVRNGTPLQGKITGAGCMLSCLCAAYVVALPDDPLRAVLAAVVHMGLAGQLAEKRLTGQEGTGSFRSYLIDALSKMEGGLLEAGAQVVKASDMCTQGFPAGRPSTLPAYPLGTQPAHGRPVDASA